MDVQEVVTIGLWRMESLREEGCSEWVAIYSNVPPESETVRLQEPGEGC